ncbi:MAG: hypothetical protein JST40_06765 [Armatimonadetes bacterium]|nr:hypothetical protein [Armatimonadota bacterium]
MRRLILGTFLMALAMMSFGQLQDEFWNGVAKPELRVKYWRDGRALPNGEIPPGGAQQAWLQAQELERYVEPGRTAALSPDWEFMGPLSTDEGWLARVNALAIDPTRTNIVYAGSAKGGLWKSTNSGSTWTNLTDTLSSQTIGAVVLDPQNPDTVLMGTGEEYYAGYTWSGVGVFRSLDGGATWTQYGASTFAGHRIGDLAIAPTNSNVWLVGSDQGLYVTTNAGATFTRKVTGRCTGVVFHPTNSSVAWAGVAGKGVYKTSDGGATWTLTTGLPASGYSRVELDVARSNPNILYTVIENGYIQNIYKSTDGGATWATVTYVSGGASYCWYCIGIAVSPTDPNVVVLCGMQLYKTVNGGGSWTNITPDHPDFHQAKFVPGSGSQVYIGEDAGLYYTSNVLASSVTWQKKNSGRGTMEYYEIGVHPTDPNRMGSGAQDNSTQLRMGPSTDFSIWIGGDGFRVAYRPDNGNYILAEYQYGNVYRSTNGGTTWNYVFTPSDSSDWNTPVIYNQGNGNHAYVGSTALNRSTNAGASFTALTATLTNGSTLSEIETTAAFPDVLYTGSNDGVVCKSTNILAATPTFTKVSIGLPSGAVGGIGIDPTNTNHVWVGFESSSGLIYRSTNGGTTWTSAKGNLPNAAITGVKFNPLDTSMVIVGTDVGVFVSTNNGASWMELGSALPAGCPVSAIAVNGTTGYLNVSTYGRGIWRMPLPRAVNVTGLLNFESDTSTQVHNVTFRFLTPGTSTVEFSRTVAVTPGTAFTVMNVPNGTYDVRIASQPYLWKRVNGINVSNGNGTMGTSTLLAGDVDGDNAVTIFDYVDLSNAFDTSFGDAGFNANADLDRDGTVTIFDYILLSNNFDKFGDN